MIRTLCLALIATTAAAAPTTVQHQGRLLDAAGGTVEGTHDVTVRLYDQDGLEGGGWTRVAAMSGSYAVCGMAAPQGIVADVAAGTAPSWMTPAQVEGLGWEDRQVLVYHSASNHVRFTSTHTGWSWTNIANGNIGTSNPTSYSIRFARQGATSFSTLNNSPSSCNQNGGDCLLGGFDASGQWTTILGIGAHGRVSHAQNADCQTNGHTANHRGIYSGNSGGNSWNQSAFVYVR